MPVFDVLVVGDANPDLVLRGDVRPRFGQAEQLLSAADLVLGGSAAITATGCARLGLRTALVAAVGADEFGRLVRAWLAARGVALDHVRTVAGLPTGVSVILSAPDDRAILTLPGTIPAVSPAQLTDGVLATARHLHVASLFLQPGLAAGLPAVLRRARALGLTVSLDTNWDPAGRWAGLPEVLAETDLVLPNAAELLALTGRDPALATGTDPDTTDPDTADPDTTDPDTTDPDTTDPDATDRDAADRDAVLAAAAGELVAGGTTVVLKDGARGARAWWPGGGCRAPGLPVQVADTTGAGDSFNAGFLAAYLGGRPLPEAVAWAAAAGSLSTRAAGGTAAQADPDELRAAIAGTPAANP
jgi:sugar/nucleoside kinase (ribokinase family)